MIAFLLTWMLFFLLSGTVLPSASITDVSLSRAVFSINEPSKTILADFVFPILLAISVAGTAMTSTSVRRAGSLISEESNRKRPSGLSLGRNLFNDASLITISMSGFVTTGEPINSSEIITVQFAVPPRTSAPYEGNHVTSLPSSIPAYATILPKKSMPWPPNPPIMIFFSSYPASSNLSLKVPRGYTDVISF